MVKSTAETAGKVEAKNRSRAEKQSWSCHHGSYWRGKYFGRACAARRANWR